MTFLSNSYFNHIIIIALRYENYNVKKTISNFKKLNLIKVMAIKKAPGRPKGEAALKQSKAPEKLILDVDENKDQENAKNQSKEIEQNDNQDLAGEEKVKSELDILKEKNTKLEAELAKKPKEGTTKTVEVTTGTTKKPLTKVRRQNNLHDVYVKGKLRSMTRQSYEAIARDPKLDVSIPKGSTLVEPKIQPCVNC